MEFSGVESLLNQGLKVAVRVYLRLWAMLVLSQVRSDLRDIVQILGLTLPADFPVD